MTEHIKLSRRRPAGHVNNWPIGDYNGFVALVQAAVARTEDHPVERVSFAAKELGIHHRHWLVLAVLAGTYQKFPLCGGHFFAEDAEVFLRMATTHDLEDREMADWARRLARAGPHP